LGAIEIVPIRACKAGYGIITNNAILDNRSTYDAASTRTVIT
jgi:hypothetical protein